MIRPVSVTIRWDLVPDSTSYDILRDGVKVSGTRVALQARLGVLPGGHVWTIRALPSGKEQSLNMRLADPA